MKQKLGRSYKAGGAHASVSVKHDVIEHDLDVEKMSKHPAEAMAKAVGAAIRNIQQGAREGAHKLFNRTGHLANGITAMPKGHGAHDIVPPPDRLNSEAMMERLRSLLVVDERPVHEAAEKSLEHAIRKRGH